MPLKPNPSLRKSTYYFGLFAERVVILYLRLCGYRILAWRYKTNFGEIDIIAKKSNLIALVEVKARRRKVSLIEMLLPKQINRMKKTAEFFLFKNPALRKHVLRFDFAEVNRFFVIKYHKNFIS